MRRTLLSLAMRIGRAAACRSNGRRRSLRMPSPMHGEAGAGGRISRTFPMSTRTRPRAARIDYACAGHLQQPQPVHRAGRRRARPVRRGFRHQYLRHADDALPRRALHALSAAGRDRRDGRGTRASSSSRSTRAPDFPTARRSRRTTSSSRWNLFRDKARPLYQNWIKTVDRMEKVGERGVRFTFNDRADRESPLLLALLPILPKHATDAENFDKSTLKPLVGSGPYTVDAVKPGEYVSLKRHPDYWAKDIPSKIGFDNYDEIRINYIRDENTMFEAFKKGNTDIHVELDSGRWESRLRFSRPPTDGRVVKETFVSGLPSGMFGFVLNTRRDVFKDRGCAAPPLSTFSISNGPTRTCSPAPIRAPRAISTVPILASTGVPASAEEKALLAPFPDAVTPESWPAPGRRRNPTAAAATGIPQAGLDELQGCRLHVSRTARCSIPSGKQLAFEIMLNGRSGEADQHRLAAHAGQPRHRRDHPFGRQRTISEARSRPTTSTSCCMRYTSSLSPGGEQVGRWGSSSRDLPGTYNFAGVADPAIDAVIDAIVQARAQGGFRNRRARLDRVAAQRLLCRSALSPARSVAGALESYQTSGKDAYIRLSTADVVARGLTAPERWTMTECDHHRRCFRRRLSLVLHRPEAAGQRHRVAAGDRRRSALAAVPARSDHSRRRHGPQGLHAGQIRQRGAAARNARAHRAARRGRRHQLRLRRHQGVAQHARRASRHPLGRGGRWRPRTAWCATCSSSISSRASISATGRALVEAARECRHGCDGRRNAARRRCRPRGRVAKRSPPPRSMGITGVPCFLLESKYAVMGAQDAATLADAIRQVAAAKANGELDQAT